MKKGTAETLAEGVFQLFCLKNSLKSQLKIFVSAISISTVELL